jgi:vancomycin resistance protein YoaR
VSDAPYRGSDRRVFWWMLLGLVVIFGGMYVALATYAGQRLPHGTSVNDIEIGGMRPAAAERKLSEGLQAKAAEPMTLSAGGERTTLRPADAGFTVDVPATVRQAQRASGWDPRTVWDHFAGGEDRGAVVHVDQARLDAAIAAFADQVDEPARQGSVTFQDGQADAHYPHKGLLVNRAVAANVVRSEFLHSAGSGHVVTLPTDVDEPDLTSSAVSQAMDTFGNPAVAAPVVVRLAGEGVQLEPQDYTSALSMRTVGEQLVPDLDEHRILRLLRPKMRQVDRAPRDARIVVRGGRPRVVPARRGVTFRDADVTSAFLDVLTKTGSDRVLSVRSRPARPKFTTADARRLKVTERVSGFTTHFPYAAYRNVNISQAARRIDGTLLKPGQTFSMNRTVGERTAANGFMKGYVIADGVFKQELGGGVSQVASTTFNAAFFAGLQDVAHKAHSFYINRYPVGREATVVWPHTDLKFKNTTPYGVLIRESVTRATPGHRGTVRVSMYSTKTWDIRTTKSARYAVTPPRTRHLKGAGCVPNKGYAGFDIDVRRLFYRHGSRTLDHRETMHTHYTPSDTVDCS